MSILSTKSIKNKRGVDNLHLHATDKYDKEKHHTDFYISTSRYELGIIFTNNPIAKIQELKPKNIFFDTTDVSGELVGLYINTLCNEDYIHQPEKSLELNYSDKYWVNNLLYFKRKSEKEIKKNVKRYNPIIKE